jgi:hypothetical protein
MQRPKIKTASYVERGLKYEFECYFPDVGKVLPYFMLVHSIAWLTFNAVKENAASYLERRRKWESAQHVLPKRK